ncbi:MAG: response regulator transcription factor [Bacteroidetes bacterium]|nr:response regulator transcription factor [Bacteroidota bacterium]
MIRYVILEDEDDQVEVLNMYINRYHNALQFAGSAKTIQKAIDLIQSEKPDIIFLDVHLEDGSGFEIIQQLQGFQGALLVFTAFEDQALNAYRHNAIDFIEKPINRKELEIAINKALKLVREKTQSKAFILSLAEGKRILDENEIILLCANGSATTFYIYKNSKVEEIFSGYSLGKHEEKLSSPPFYRIHDKYLLNTNYIARIGIEHSIILNIEFDIEKKTGKSLHVSQQRVKDFNEWMQLKK